MANIKNICEKQKLFEPFFNRGQKTLSFTTKQEKQHSRTCIIHGGLKNASGMKPMTCWNKKNRVNLYIHINMYASLQTKNL
jgi:hypothetical protein